MLLQAYFVPAMGSAPGWASFLEGLTEELEEDAAPTIYDDYMWGSSPILPLTCMMDFLQIVQ